MKTYICVDVSHNNAVVCGELSQLAPLVGVHVHTLQKHIKSGAVFFKSFVLMEASVIKSNRGGDRNKK